jgi:mannose-6-phosphate isomerase-like protein (cupin superfamily)
MEKVFCENIESNTILNEKFRSIKYTGKFQLVYMNLKPNENISKETHKTTDQFIRIEEGNGIAILNGKRFMLSKDTAIIIPAGTEHEIINQSSKESLKLYTIYSSPEHKLDEENKSEIDEENEDTDDSLKYKKKYLKYKKKYLQYKTKFN